MFKKTISLILSVSLILTQPVFAQGVGELNIGKYLSQMSTVKSDSFRPPHLRYISYDIKSNDFKLLLDQGDLEKSPGHQVTRSPEKLENALKIESENLFNYFLIGLSLPNDKFWVNLRPDAPEQIIDPELEKTDMGKIMLEADLELKKDTAGLTSPQNPEGREYWDKLYKKAGELFGTENITIPTITRPWIVPGEVIIRESEDSAYIYKANLKVMLEEDYLTGRGGSRTAPTYQQYFSDPRMKELNKYSTELIKELILPKLTQEINTSKKYAQLRQVFFSLILSRWFKDRYRSQRTEDRAQSTEKSSDYLKLIDAGNLDNLTSKDHWSKDYYFSQYQKSFQQGEYNLKEQITTPTGQVIRSYVSGGIKPVPEDISSFRRVGGSSPIDLEALIPIATTITIVGSIYIMYLLQRDNIAALHQEESRKLKIISDGIKRTLDYADNGLIASGDTFLLHRLFRDYQNLTLDKVATIVDEAIERLKSFNKLVDEAKQRNREIVITILEESLKKIIVYSPLVMQEEDLVAYRENTEQMAKKFYDTYIMNGEYKEYPAFSNAKNAQDIKNILTSIFKNQMLTNYPDAGNKAKVAREIINRYFIIEPDAAFASVNLKHFIIQLKNDGGGASSALTKTDAVPTQMAETLGGIDFTRINYLTQPMGNFQGLDLRLPLLSKAELKGIDISWELAALEQMVNAKIEVSTDRLKRLLAAMSQKDALNAQRETQLLPLLLRLCWLKEERGVETTPDFRAVLLIADTGLFVEQGNTKHSLN